MRSLLPSLVAASALMFAAGSASAAQGTTTAALALRAAPASNTELLLTIPAGSAVTVGRCSGAWCRVTWNSYSGYAVRRGLTIAVATPTPGPVRGGYTTADGSQLWPILPPYPYRSGYYPKADWYHDIPPYVAIEPSFYRRRYFMIAQEHNRYRYVPHIFHGNRYGDGGPIEDINMRAISSTLKNTEGY
jgi:Bacterial SH3 domain